MWCVFDKDDFKDFDEAIRKSARYPKVNCAFSNEAIEYWFTLYFSNKTAPFCIIVHKMYCNYFKFDLL